MSEQNPSGMPPWAKKVDDFGNRFRSPDKPSKSRRGEYIWAIIWNVIFLYIVNRVPHWNLEFITERYMVILWILNANLIIQIAGNILMLFFGMRWVRYLVSSILLPLTFIASMYGMNIDLPIQKHPDSFLIVSGVMVVIAIAMIIYFRARKWM